MNYARWRASSRAAPFKGDLRNSGYLLFHRFLAQRGRAEATDDTGGQSRRSRALRPAPMATTIQLRKQRSSPSFVRLGDDRSYVFVASPLGSHASFSTSVTVSRSSGRISIMLDQYRRVQFDDRTRQVTVEAGCNWVSIPMIQPIRPLST